jgi:hypothetical protein
LAALGFVLAALAEAMMAGAVVLVVQGYQQHYPLLLHRALLVTELAIPVVVLANFLVYSLARPRSAG